MLYNPDPTQYAFQEAGGLLAARYIKAPPGDTIIPFSEAEEGDMAYKDFLEGLAVRGAFKSEREWAEAAGVPAGPPPSVDSEVSQARQQELQRTCSFSSDAWLAKCKKKLAKRLAAEETASEELERCAAARMVAEADLAAAEKALA